MSNPNALYKEENKHKFQILPEEEAEEDSKTKNNEICDHNENVLNDDDKNKNEKNMQSNFCHDENQNLEDQVTKDNTETNSKTSENGITETYSCEHKLINPVPISNDPENSIKKIKYSNNFSKENEKNLINLHTHKLNNKLNYMLNQILKILKQPNKLKRQKLKWIISYIKTFIIKFKKLDLRINNNIFKNNNYNHFVEVNTFCNQKRKNDELIEEKQNLSIKLDVERHDKQNKKIKNIILGKQKSITETKIINKVKCLFDELMLHVNKFNIHNFTNLSLNEDSNDYSIAQNNNFSMFLIFSNLF